MAEERIPPQDLFAEQSVIGSLLPGSPPVVACGEGGLALEQVQPEGRPVMGADAWRRGIPRDHILLGCGEPHA